MSDYTTKEQKSLVLSLAAESIKKHEGFVDHVYKCPAGFPTIGYGFRVSTMQRFGIQPAGHMQKRFADFFLHFLISDIYTILKIHYPWFSSLPFEISAVCIEMVFQLGFTGFSEFRKTIAFLKSGHYQSAAVEMLDSKWAKKDTPHRAKALSSIIGNYVEY